MTTIQAHPVAAPQPALGVAMVPQPRRLGEGGMSDLIAAFKHRRRMSRRGLLAR